MNSAGEYINALDLKQHPEGGWYREVYRSPEVYTGEGADFPVGRSYSTSIYFLLGKDDISALHRIKSDEIWHFYDGGVLEIVSIDENGIAETHKLGLNISGGEQPQVTISAGKWFGSRVLEGDFVFCGCTVSPGFMFDDFEMAERQMLFDKYPGLETCILNLTYE